jgi:hypothetical protein
MDSVSLLPLFHSTSSAIDMGCFLAYLCSTTVLNIPVVLLPVAAAEQTSQVSSLVASIASIAVFGSALGKLCNGFVCEEFGNARSSFWYMVGLCACTKWFASGSLQWASAGMEFFGSIQWTALSVLLATKYEGDAASYTKGIAAMSLASTGGQFITKTIGMILLQYFHWKTIANAASLIALLGALFVWVLLQEAKGNDIMTFAPQSREARWSQIRTDSYQMIKSPVFWAVGVAHSASMLGRSSDRVLGAFFHEATSFSPRLCGGLTLSSTIGLLHGLKSARSFARLQTVKEKERFMKRRYIGATLSALSLAACAMVSSAGRGVNLSNNVTACWIAVSAFFLTSNTAFLFFHIPNMVAKTFASQAVCLSAIDAVGFFVAAPIWKAFSLIQEAGYGYGASWMMVTSIFVMGGTLMCRFIKPVLIAEK